MMAGADGLREEVEGHWEISIWLPLDAPDDEREAFFEAVADAVHEFEPRSRWDPTMVAGRVLDAVPDVPPTTPLANHIKAGMLRGRVRLSDVPPDPPAADLADDLALDYIRAYYALVTAARALLDAMTRFGPDDSGQLWDAAQALRALVGDETPGTGDGA